MDHIKYMLKNANSACICHPLSGGLLNVKGKATGFNRIHMNSAGNIKHIKCYSFRVASCSTLLYY